MPQKLLPINKENVDKPREKCVKDLNRHFKKGKCKEANK